MYEAEANRNVESAESLPPQIAQQFGEMVERISARSVLSWSEHCTECVWPTCYTTCDLYSPREDGRCRRFMEGMVRVECPASVNSYVLKIQFKQWAKLWAPASVRLYDLDRASRVEKRDYRIGNVLQSLPLGQKLKSHVINKRYSFKKSVASQPSTEASLPTAFLVECYNPTKDSMLVSLTLRPVGRNAHIPFQRLLEFVPGFNRVRIPMAEIAAVMDVRAPFNAELIPNDVSRSAILYFGLMDFVREADPAVGTDPHQGAKPVKCIVWDLDNTMWDGILVEDGPERLVLKPGVADLIRALDAHGILQSIASKNDPNEVLDALRRFGLAEYFLYPQVSWMPKSESLAEIARQLNIGIDSLLFIDDSEFELNQVQSRYPELRTMHARDYLSLHGMKELRTPATAESAERRKLYQAESVRRETTQGFGDDYLGFLRYAQIELQISPLKSENLDRVHELTQRTNQMNFSGNRYCREVLQQILNDSFMRGYVLSCQDRFGSYGIVGFSVVDSRGPLMTDLMFSCRVQSKRVEHAFVSHIIRTFMQEERRDFLVHYKKTHRNAPAGKVFEDLGLQELELIDGVTLLVFKKDRVIPDDGIITVVELGTLVRKA